MRVAFIAALVSTAAVARGENRDVPAFSAVHISSGMKATIEIGPRKAVHIEADEATLPLIETVVEDGTLEVRFQRSMRWHGERSVKLTIRTPELHAVGASGGSVVRAVFSRGQRSEVEASGGSEITARGIDTAEFDAQASGGSILTID